MTSQSLSDLWRENRSKDAGTDLASLLDGARIIAQSLNPNTEVTFAGVKLADTNRKQIRLSSKILGNEYPVPGNIVDVLLGLTVHEVGHTLFSENRVEYTDTLTKKVGLTYSRDRPIFERLVDVFEDIYIDHLMTAYPGYRDYLQRERTWALGKINPDGITKPLEAKSTRVDILNAMVYLTLIGGKMPSNISQENISILGKIATYANKMCTKKLSKASAVIKAWGVLVELPTMLTDEERGFGPKPEAAPGAEPEAGEAEEEAKPAVSKAQEDKTKEQKEQEELEEAEMGEGEEEETGEGEEPGEEAEAGEQPEPELGPDTQLDLASELDNLVDDQTKLPDDLAEEVSEAVIEKRADLSQLVSYLAKDSRYTVIAYTPNEDAQRAAEARSQTSSVEEKLRRILQDYRLRRTKDYRGLMSGRISSRRLHRVAYGDQRVFQRREKPEEIDMAVCLLMDLSGSVCSYKNLIDQITCAISDAFTKEKMEFIALGYSENSGVVSIPRLYDREVARVNLGLEKEWHMTPSYEGLAVAVAQLLRLTGRKQKILFHFTDGEPNVGGWQPIPELLDNARAKGIIDIHVCLTGSSFPSGRFRSLYGEDTMVTGNIDQLPDVIDAELRRRLKI